jgi:hypothetical protein
MALRTGTRLGPYEILARLGAGGRGRSTAPASRGSHLGPHEVLAPTCGGRLCAMKIQH